MLFNSFEYIFIFLPTLLFIYYYLNFKLKLLKITLVIFGLFFYSYWNINFLPILLTSILVNYFFASKIQTNISHKKKLLFVAITFNLLLLIAFKYLDFVIINYNYVFNQNISYFNLSFPLAISFYTFQQITYLVDSFYNEIKNKKIIDYFLFVTFFPQLIAGPIINYNFLIKQFSFNKSIIDKFFIRFPFGFFLISIGLFKKVVIADNLAIFVNNAYDNYLILDFITSWILSISFAFQFYFDFTGYVDMATGSAYLFGINLPQNFNSPYKSRNLIDFWQRWHMTLTSFLTRYVYYPLMKNFNQFNLKKSLIIIFLVFIISGLWHGPSWLFVIFGAMHGIGVVFNHIVNEKFPNLRINYFVSWFATFVYVNFTFIFFRSNSLDQALIIIKKMLFINSELNLHNVKTIFENLYLSNKYLFFLIFLIILSFMSVTFKNTNEIKNKFKDNNQYLLITLLSFIVSLYCITPNNEFIYFKF